METAFQALVADQAETFSLAVQRLETGDLPAGEVLIRVQYSGVNYKDGLASVPNSTIVKAYPFIPGIDLAGEVVSSEDNRYKQGDAVLVTGYGLGVTHFGGFSEYARVPADWIVPIPEGLTAREAMILGTAGFTAALSVQALEQSGIVPERGTVLVTGATGGVGSSAVAMLARLGYHVAASTGKPDESGFLHSLGAAEVLSRTDVYDPEAKQRPLDKQRWQAAVDPVGGPQLASILSKIAYGGAVAVSGLTGGAAVPVTVMPFILRGVSLLGIDSVECPAELRRRVWSRLGTDLKPAEPEKLVDREIGLSELPQALSDIRNAKMRGRTLVRL
ncbi:acrylyl-CoA reductase family protein [Paenibacillus glufosinatiresistens]|uniref:acrylyl-CoA reductase family protein n=1 Tax=Paenibacillus glufosinatiresistens TaxID=3070657 RepID=UPI00286E5F26|nr:acryloyl-CoA reductase [Paenibacillus sp. YX.27]